jgi:serine/arginine repetitive matrix protein 2
MIKAHTTDANPRRASGVTFDLPPEGSRPSFRPRSQTQSAHEVLKANERDGVINEPKSALDKIIGDEPLAASSNGSTSSASTAILKPVLPVPPPKTVQFPMKPRVSETLELASTSTTSGTTDKGTARAESVTVKSHNKDGRVASNVSVGSTNSRRSRRSMSMGDAPDPDVVGIDLIFA